MALADTDVVVDIALLCYTFIAYQAFTKEDGEIFG